MAKTKVIEKPKVVQPVPRQVQAELYHPPNKSSAPVVETKAKPKQDPNVDVCRYYVRISFIFVVF